MKQKKISHFFDTLFWYLVYSLPLIVLLILTLKQGDFVTFSDVFSSLNFGGIENSAIYTGLSQIFGASGIMPIFTNPDLLLYMAYFVYSMIIHLFVDFLLFIPRLCHKWLKSITGGEE